MQRYIPFKRLFFLVVIAFIAYLFNWAFSYTYLHLLHLPNDIYFSLYCICNASLITTIFSTLFKTKLPTDANR